MTDYQREIDRYNALERVLSDVEAVTGVSHAEDYVPPHKSAAFTPYDAVVAFESDHWTAGDVEALLDKHELPYDRVVGAGRNDSRYPGATAAFISLVPFQAD